MFNMAFGLILVQIAAVLCHNVLDFGTVTQGPNPTSEQEFANSEAMLLAFQAANSSNTDRTVVIPKDVVISCHSMNITGVTDIEIIIDG